MAKRTRDTDVDWQERERLHRAAREGDLAQAQRLLASGIDLHVFDELGNTPLHCAVQGEHFHIVQRLLDAGAYINAQDVDRIGETPLGSVADTCTPEMASYVLERGADPSLLGWMGLTAALQAAALQRGRGS